MRVLLVGAGGVGTALARIAAGRPFTGLVIEYRPPGAYQERSPGGR